MQLIEFEGQERTIAINTSLIHGITKFEDDDNMTRINMARLSDSVDDDYIVKESYTDVLLKLDGRINII